jgi:hypothetical protein
MGTTKIGAWIHEHDDLPLEKQIRMAAENGLDTIRSYTINYSEAVAPALKQTGMSLLGGLHVEAGALVTDWRSQVRLDALARYHELDVRLEGICVGNELREGGDAPDQKRFTARLSFGLARLLETYRRWLDEHGLPTALTYAMEGIVLDSQGCFCEWLWPLIDACDAVSLNLYPMDASAWFTFDAFEESRRFLHDARVRNLRLTRMELRLRQVLEQLERVDKPLVLSETGFPSAVGYHLEGDRLVVPESDTVRYGEAMLAFMEMLHSVNADYSGRLRSVYFYEWRDNLHHSKIWNVEQSPIHVAFGLCDRFGVPKFDLRKLTGG